MQRLIMQVILLLFILKRRIVPRINNHTNGSSYKSFTCIVYHAKQKIAIDITMNVPRNLSRTSKRFYRNHYLHVKYGSEWNWYGSYDDAISRKIELIIISIYSILHCKKKFVFLHVFNVYIIQVPIGNSKDGCFIS